MYRQTDGQTGQSLRVFLMTQRMEDALRKIQEANQQYKVVIFFLYRVKIFTL